MFQKRNSTSKPLAFEVMDPQTDAKSSGRKTVSRITRAFAETTTAHGFAHVAASSNLQRRLLWIVLITAAYVGLFLQILPLIKRYIDKPITTSSRFEAESEPAFPAVTVCNLNMIKASTWKTRSSDRPDSSVSRFVDMLSRPVNDSRIARLTNYSVAESMDIRDKCHKGQCDMTSIVDLQEKYIARSLLSAHLASLGSDVYDLGHSFEGLIRKCRWKRFYDCLNVTNWNWFWDWKYGNCFTFNSGIDKNGSTKPLLRTRSSGADEGLELWLNVEVSDYADYVDTSGVRLSVTYQKIKPAPYENGVGLSGGNVHYVGLSKKKIFRTVKGSNTSCVSISNSNAGYTAIGCEKRCLSSTQVETCNCHEFSLPDIADSVNGNVTCITYDQLTCAQHLVTPESCLETCQPPCEETLYEQQTQTAALRIKDMKDLQDSRVKVMVFMTTLESEIVEYQRIYEIENLLGDIGGQLGLWSGFSILTVAEIIVFACYLPYTLLHKPTRKK